MLQVDQIVGAVGEEGEPAIGAGPARGRIGRRDELGHDRRRAAEGRLVEHGQILAYGMAWIVGRLPLVARRRVLAVGVGLDHRGVYRETLAAHQPLGNTARDGLLEQDRKSTRLKSSHYCATRMPPSACKKK